MKTTSNATMDELHDLKAMRTDKGRPVYDVGIVNLGCDDDPWQIDDREWFEQHPARTMRLRTYYAGEFDPIGAIKPGAFVLVKQVEPGSRRRVPIWGDEDGIALIRQTPDADPILDILLGLMMGAVDRGRGADLSDLLTQATAIKAAVDRINKMQR